MPDKSLQREKFFVRAFLFCCAIALAHFIHIAWLGYVEAPPGANVPEPDLRIAMPFVLSHLTRLLHPHDGTLVVTATDFISAYLAFDILYTLTVAGLRPAGTKSPRRLLVIALFLAFLQFPISFVVPWQRPETLPSTLYLAVSLLCLHRARQSSLWTVLLLLAATMETLVRADVAFAFGGALLLMSLVKDTLTAFGSRSANIARAIGILAISGSFQAYMQLVKFRDFPYQKGSPILANLNPHLLTVFFSATFPFFLTAYLLFRQRHRFNAIEAMAVCVSLVYFPLYFCLGVIGEVRIYVPFLFCLCVPAARITASYLLANDVVDEPVAA
jgi:hypothetical protein